MSFVTTCTETLAAVTSDLKVISADSYAATEAANATATG